MTANLLDSDLMRTFVAVCDAGSFRAASHVVHRTPSAVSMQMAKLEEQIGCALFRKNGRSVSLSPAGEELLGYARRILSLSEEAIARFRAPALDGKITIGAPDDYETRLLPQVLAAFAKACPDVEIDLTLDESAALSERVSTGEVDVALISAEVEGPGDIVCAEPFVWMGLAGGQAKRRRPVPLAVAGVGCSWRQRALDALERASLTYRIMFNCAYSHGHLAALHADLAIAALPASYLLPGLERISPSEGLPDLGIVSSRLCVSSRASEAATVFANIARERLADTPMRAA